VVECWPEDVAAWLRLNRPGRPLVPPHLAACGRAAAGEAPPRIFSPAAGRTYLLEEGEPAGAQQLMLKASSRGGTLYWFVDGTLVATGAPLEPVFWPLARGAHTVVCSDEAGRSAVAAFSVH
jgi:membrane carboxypeptidase/penicillin-binding protein PbpC